MESEQSEKRDLLAISLGVGSAAMVAIDAGWTRSEWEKFAGKEAWKWAREIKLRRRRERP